MKVSKPILRSLSPPRNFQSPQQSQRSVLQNKGNFENISPEKQLVTDRTFHSVKNQNEKKYMFSDKKFDSKGFSGSPKKMIESFQTKFNKSKKNQSTIENLDPGVPTQKAIVESLRECTRVLKTLEREYEYKIKEKKTLQIVVDELKKDVLLAESKNQKFTTVHRKWENEAIKMNESALNKENQRENIIESIEKLKTEVTHLDNIIEEDIKKNRDLVMQIHKEKEQLAKLDKRVDKMKKSHLKITKEKEKIRLETIALAKNIPLLEDKIREMVKEKETFVINAHETAQKPRPKK